MGLPLFKTPTEPGVTATAIEKSLANARSSIRRNRPCDSRLDLPRRTNSISRRAWQEFSVDDEHNNFRGRIIQGNSTQNIDTPSALWNSRVIRIFNENRERIRYRDELDLEHQNLTSEGDLSNHETTEHYRIDGTLIQPTQPRRARTRRLRRMSGRHSLLSRPIHYNDFYPRLAPPISVTDSTSPDLHDQESQSSQTEVESPSVEMNQIIVVNRQHGPSDAIHQARTAIETSNQNGLDVSPQHSMHAHRDQQSIRNRSMFLTYDSTSDSLSENMPENRLPANLPLNYDRHSFREISPSLSETTVSDKVEGPQSNIDRILDDTGDEENESSRVETLENRNSEQWRTYADVVAARGNLFYHPDRVRFDVLNDRYH